MKSSSALFVISWGLFLTMAIIAFGEAVPMTLGKCMIMIAFFIAGVLSSAPYPIRPASGLAFASWSLFISGACFIFAGELAMTIGRGVILTAIYIIAAFASLPPTDKADLKAQEGIDEDEPRPAPPAAEDWTPKVKGRVRK